MKKKITLIISMFFLAVSTVSAQGNWVVADQSISPSSPISSCLKSSVAGSYTWLSFNTFLNDNHLMQLAYALPPAVDILTGIPSITDNSGNAIPGLNAIFTPNSGGYTATFAPGTSFAPGFKFIFRIDSLDIMDNQPYTNQQATHSISFVAAPAGESFNDNLASVTFSTTQCNLPLPTDLLNFTASLVTKNDTKQAQLDWMMSSENKYAYYIIQKSLNSSDWSNIGRRVDDNRSTGIQKDYKFFDHNLVSGTNFYRIQLVTKDGTKTNSEIRKVNWISNEGNGVTLYPNPVSDKLSIDITNNTNTLVDIKVRDMSGRIVKSISSKISVGVNKLHLSMGELAKGVYGVELYRNATLIHKEKISRLD